MNSKLVCQGVILFLHIMILMLNNQFGINDGLIHSDLS